MIKGVGCDIIEIERFYNWDEKKILRFFNQKEYAELVKNQKNNYACFAGKL